MKVHVLKGGVALCGAGMPSAWPKTDRWVAYTDLEVCDLATCSACLDQHTSANLPAVSASEPAPETDAVAAVQGRLDEIAGIIAAIGKKTAVAVDAFHRCRIERDAALAEVERLRAELATLRQRVAFAASQTAEESS